MARSNWGMRAGQERTLAVHITRTGWDRALGLAVSTDPGSKQFKSYTEWQLAFESAKVHVQWDTERSLQGHGLGHYSIQVGLSRHIISEYVDDWVTRIEDVSERVRKIRTLLNERRIDRAKALLPAESLYPVTLEFERTLGMS